VAARLAKSTYDISALCPICEDTTVFEITAHSERRGPHYIGSTAYTRQLYVFGVCKACQSGSLAIVSDRGSRDYAVITQFFPIEFDVVPIPSAVPPDVVAEFREAENCAMLGFNRAASALFRSALEKTLKANGYAKDRDTKLTDLYKRIEAAAADGVITEARRKKAHEDVRALGNDVLHDEWRVVSNEEVEDAHKYTQRIIEDLYDDRPTVEGMLIAKGRIVQPKP
jgi:hypothetical protein